MLEEFKQHSVIVKTFYDDKPGEILSSIRGKIISNAHGKIIRFDIFDAEADSYEVTLGDFDFDEIKEMIKILDK